MEEVEKDVYVVFSFGMGGVVVSWVGWVVIGVFLFIFKLICLYLIIVLIEINIF